MTIAARHVSTMLIALLAATAARAQQAEVKLEGTCGKLVIAGQDITPSCRPSLTNVVVGTRTSFDFAASDGQTLSFSGAGAQQELTELTDPLQPISLVVPGQRSADSIVRNPAPAVGACRFSMPSPGKSMIACEATSQG